METLQKKLKTPILSIIFLSLVLNFAAAPIAALAAINCKIDEEIVSVKDAADCQSRGGTSQNAASSASSPIKAAYDQSAGSKTGLIGYLGTGFLWGFNGLVVSLGTMTAGLVDLAAWMFNGAIEVSSSTLRQYSIIQKGWEVSRDVANIFFILILLTIAIATILGSATYGAKSLLPQLIVVALLINFSLPLGYIIIDATNILGLQFYRAITVENPNGRTSVASAIIAGTKLQNVFNMEPPQATIGAQLDQVGKGIAVGAGTALGIAACLGAAAVSGGAGLITCGWLGFAGAALAGAGGGLIGWALVKGNDIGSAIEFFYLSAGSLIFMIAILFVFVAGTIFLMMRAVMLVLLLVLAPIAFVSYTLPITERKLWQPWWETFLNQAFFFPAFMFLIYISIGFINQFGKDVPIGTIVFNPSAALLILTATLMLTISFFLARKMSILLADGVMKYATMTKSWLTGAIGGVALRNTVGRLGGAMQKAPAIQGSVFGQRISQMMTRAGAKLPGGSYEEMQKAQATIALKKGESSWAQDFTKLGTPGRVAMLSNMNDEQRKRLRDNLNQISPQMGQAFENAVRLHFGEAALAKTDLAAWKSATPDEQKNLAPYSEETIEQILRSFADDDARARWMSKLSPENKDRATDIMNARFGTAEKTKYNKAEERQKMRDVESNGTFDSFVKGLGEDEASDNLEAADDRQKLLWLESINKIGDKMEREAKMQMYQKIIRSKFSPEEQENFHKNVLRRASNEVLENYVVNLSDDVSRGKTIASISAPQQAYLFDRAQNTGNNQLLTTLENTTKTLPADVQRDYHEAVAKKLGQKTNTDIITHYGAVSDDIGLSFVRSRPPDRNLEIINTPGIDKGMLKKFMSHIKLAGLGDQYAKRLNPVYKVQYIDKNGTRPAETSPDWQGFVDAIKNEIKNISPTNLVRNTSPDVMKTPEFKIGFLGDKAGKGGGNLAQLIALNNGSPANTEALKNMINEALDGNLKASSKDITDKFKAKYNNEVLGEQIANLRSKQQKALSPAQKQFIEDIFETK